MVMLVSPGQRFESSPTSSSAQTTVTADGSTNTKGAFAQLIAATAFKAEGILVTVKRLSGNTADHLIDIAIGAALSEVVIIPNILLSSKGGVANDFCIGNFYVPFHIPAGTRIAARSQSTTGSATVTVGVTLVGGEGLLMCERCETWGANTADSGGTSVDAGASANTKGTSYAQLTASSGIDARYLVVCVGNALNGAAATANFLLDISIGAGGSEVVIVPDLHYLTTSLTHFPAPAFIAFPCNIPAGTRVAVRSQSSTNDATDRLTDVVILAFG